MASAALVGGAPLVVDPGGYNRHSALRYLFVAIVITIGLVAAWRRRDTAGLPRPFVYWWAAMLGVALAAALVAPDPLLSLLGDTVRLFGAGTWVLLLGAWIAGASAGRGGRRPIAYALVAGGAVVVVDGWVRLFVHGWSNRAVSTMGNADLLGAYLVILLPVAVAIAASEGRRVARVAAGATALTGVVLLVATRTRGAWIGAAVALALLGALRFHRYVVPIVLAGAITVVVAVVIDVGRSSSARGRVDTWANTMPALAERPLLGWGPEGFRRGFEHAVGDKWVRRYTLDQIPDRAHNRFLDVAMTTGWAGLFVDVALVVGAIAMARRALRDAEPRDRWLVAGICAGLAGYLVQSQFLFDTFDIGVIAWCLVGVLSASSAGQRPDKSVVGGIAIACVVVVVAVAVPGFVADRRMARGDVYGAMSLRPRSLDAYLRAGDTAIRRDNVAGLSHAHARLRDWRDPDVQLADADVLSRLGALTRDSAVLAQSVNEYQRVIAFAPANALAWLGVGETYTRLGDLGDAQPALSRALDLLPKSPYPAMDLALLSLTQGRPDDACRFFRLAEKIAPTQPQLADLAARVQRAAPRCVTSR